MNYAYPLHQPHESFDPTALSALDHQPYGCIKLDKSGRVLDINVAASAVLAVRRADALGKCFFTEVAPCADTPEFHGRFKTAMAGNGVLNRVVDHRFLLRHLPDAIAGINVRVHLVSSIDASGLPVVWVVTRKKIEALGDSLRGSLNSSLAAIPTAPTGPQATRAMDSVAAVGSVGRPLIQSISSGFDMSI